MDVSAQELLLHFTRGAALADHRGDMARDIFLAYELLGMALPKMNNDGWFDFEAAEERGGRALTALLHEQAAGMAAAPPKDFVAAPTTEQRPCAAHGKLSCRLCGWHMGYPDEVWFAGAEKKG